MCIYNHLEICKHVKPKVVIIVALYWHFNYIAFSQKTLQDKEPKPDAL